MRTATVVSIIVSIIFVILLIMVGLPQYSVWQKGLKGEASLREAEWDRQIAIREAEARTESAVWDKKTAIIDAEAVAEANNIIGQSLKDNEAYLRFLYIKGLQTGSNDVIYIPTEAGLPILEATRLK